VNSTNKCNIKRDTPPKNMSSFIHPRVVANLSFLLLLNKRKNDWNFGTIDSHSMFFSTMFQSFFKISSFVISRGKKLRFFWVEYPFKIKVYTTICVKLTKWSRDFYWSFINLAVEKRQITWQTDATY